MGHFYPLAIRLSHQIQRQSLLLKSLAISLTLLVLLQSCQCKSTDENDEFDKELAQVKPLILTPRDLVEFKSVKLRRKPSRIWQEKGYRSRADNKTSLPDQNDPARLKEYEAFKKSSLFLESFEPNLKYLPEHQVKYGRKSLEEIFALIKKIIIEAVHTKDYALPSTRLVMRYGTQLTAAFLRHRNGALELKNLYETKKSFYEMLAQLLDDIVALSTQAKRDRGYTKRTVDAPAFKRRALAMTDYIFKIISSAPVGAYLKWNDMTMYMDEPNNPRRGVSVYEEGADLYAQFRAMGYEGMNTVIQSIIKLFRTFGGGLVLRSLTDI